MIFDVKGEERQKAFVKLQNALFPSNEPEKVREVLSLCPPADAEFFSTICQYIHGDCEDTKEKRLFLKTAVNRDGLNFRSPFSNAFFPEVSKSYASEEVRELEAQLNHFLDHYARAHLPGALSSAFAVETKDAPLFYFALARRGREARDGQVCAHAYEVFVQVRLARKELTYKFSAASSLKYALSLEDAARRERASYEGSLNHNSLKTLSLSSAMSREELVEVVAGLFERGETALRNSLLYSVLRTHRAKLEEALERPRAESAVQARLVEEFRVLNAAQSYSSIEEL